MELRKGYRQTELGLIPEDWNDPELNSITDSNSPICYGIVQVGSFVSNGIRVLAIKNLDTDYATRIHRSSFEIERPYKRSRVQPGDVLVSIKGTTGRVGIVPHGFHGNISREIARIRLRDEIEPSFCYQVLQSESTQRRLESAVVGTTRKELSISILKQFKIPLPPTKAEQRVLSDALSDTDALILSLETLIAKKRFIKQGTMQELLRPKKGWVVDYVRNLARITTGGKNTQDRVEDGMFPFYVRSQNIERIDSYSYEGEAVLTAGDGVGTGKVFHYVEGKFNAHQRVYIISDFAVRLNGYYFFLFFSNNFYGRIMQMTAKSSVDSVRMEMIADMQVPFPPTLAEQEEIAKILSDMDAEISALEEKLTKTRLLKQGMMAELLTGRIRLVSPKSKQNVTHSSKTKPNQDRKHSDAFHEAVVISILVDKFADERFPLGRKRYTKLSYLLHRKAEEKTGEYLKKAAGPYNPKTRYAGAEGIAKNNRYVCDHKQGQYTGFVAGENIAQAKGYFAKWYDRKITDWLEQLRYKSNDELEVLATVDLAVQEILKCGDEANLKNVRSFIASEPEWKTKLERKAFSDENIQAAIVEGQKLLSGLGAV